jgi:very-short-patch-repair endonuclease
VPSHRRPAEPLPDVFLGRLAVAEGLITERQLRGPFVERVLHGVYRPAWVPLTHLMQCQAACLVLPDSAAITGVSAATVLGVPLARAGDPVVAVIAEQLKAAKRAGVRVRTSQRPVRIGRALDGVRLAEANRLAFDAVAGQPLPDAVARLDALVRAGVVDLERFCEWLGSHRLHHVRGARAAAALVDARAESLPESRTRVILHGAGIRTVPQHRVTVDGRVIARVDLAIPELRIAIEYDGRWHEDEHQRGLDNERLAALRAAGWTVVVVTAEMLRRPQLLLAAVRGAIAERTF